MFEIEENIWFWLLFLIIGMGLLFVWNFFWKKRKKHVFASPYLLKYLSPTHSPFKSSFKFFIISLSLMCFIIGLANPKIGTKLETIKREGVDIVFAIDVSKSMLAEDVAPNRLKKAQQITSEIMKTLVGDRIGIIAYAGQAVPQVPLTTDYNSARMFLENMSTDMVSSKGTTIGDAIELSKSLFSQDEETSRVLVILTDGEDHNASGNEVAKATLEKEIRIITIAVGTEKGGPIPIKKDGVVSFYKKDSNGETVITKLNAKNLNEISVSTNGILVNEKNINTTVKKVNKFLSSLDKKDFEIKVFSEYKDQFQWFLGIGLFFLILDIFLLERKTAWLRRLNLFNENE